MDFTTLSHDEFADALAAAFASLHDRVNALADSPFKTRAIRLTDISHGALNMLQTDAQMSGVIQPASGGDVKP